MSTDDLPRLRRGWTTGACATAATKAALVGLWTGAVPKVVRITLPKGETPKFDVVDAGLGESWAEAAIVKDAGDDPDVTHGATIRVRVEETEGEEVVFAAGDGVGVVTKAGLPVPVGEPAINPVPRKMMQDVVEYLSRTHGKKTGLRIEVCIPGGEDLAQKTWNPRLGIEGGLSILGTTGIVRPFSCSAWIASIHRGIDVARAEGVLHVAGCTGATSERSVQALHGLPDHAMLDMGDFVGGLLKYLKRNPVPRLTIGGGIGKITKLAQGARDLHSKRSQVNFAALGKLSESLGAPDVSRVNSALEAYEIAGKPLVSALAEHALREARSQLGAEDISLDIVIIDRGGNIIAQAGP